MTPERAREIVDYINSHEGRRFDFDPDVFLELCGAGLASLLGPTLHVGRLCALVERDDKAWAIFDEIAAQADREIAALLIDLGGEG